MSKLPVALQMYSVRDFAEKDLVGTLKKVKEFDYDGVELAGFYGKTAGEIRAALDEVGLRAICAHVPYAELTRDAKGTIADYKAVGCEWIAIPYLDEATRPGSAAFSQVLEEFNRIAKECQAQGIKLLYHNHDFEFVKMPDGSYGLDYLYAKVSGDLLETEIDTCWVKVAGEDPAAYVRKYTGRAPVVHLKDFVMDNKPGYGVARENFEFRPVGHGSQDMPGILQAALDAGAKWVVVEQDLSVGRATLEAAKMSREYLKTQGF